jgi:hypothetical protein
MSQRLCSGLNWPPLSIRASDPISICPEAVNRAGPSGTSDMVSESPIIPGRGEMLPRFSASVAVGVGHPPKPLSPVRRADARSAKIDRRKGVVRCFHVSVHMVEPVECKRARSLLTNDCARAALADEIAPDGPEVTFVGEAVAFSGLAEGLAGATSGPDGAVIRPSRKSKSMRPDPYAGEEVALREASQIIRPHVHNAAIIDFAGRDVACADKAAQPLGRVAILFVVVCPPRAHGNYANCLSIILDSIASLASASLGALPMSMVFCRAS